MNRGLRWLIAVCSAIVVLWLVLLDLDLGGPGKLAATHAQVFELQGATGCVLCHGDGSTKLAASCLSCHEAVQEQLTQLRGLHGQLDADLRSQCGSCHPEHLGAKGALLNERSFSLAGHPGPRGFGHQTVEFDLHGRHDALDCVDCHPLAEAEVLPEGESRYLAQVQSCTACHEDPHEGAMQRGCEECHGQEHQFDDLSHFPHDERFPLHASHGDLACADCHEATGAHAVATLSAPGAEFAWRACASCHESPHSEDFLRELPIPANGRPDGGQCAECHSEQHAAFHGSDVSMSLAQHLASGFALDMPHADLACAECHGTAGDFGARFPGRMSEQCASCHDDPHAGQFEHAPFAERGCLSCHAKDRFHPHDFGVDDHAQTAFALDGSHANAECSTCHQEVSGVRQFASTPVRCEACHEDVHAGSFDSRLVALGTPEAGSCALCHQNDAFSSIHAEFEHQAWTSFALEGAHDPLACEACHERSSTADALGRRFGRVSDLHPGDPKACQACHSDVHGGAFDRPGLPSRVSGKIGCARCHEQDAFHSAAETHFDHALWTAFPLEGAHAQTDCLICHGAGEGRRLGVAGDHFQGDPQLCATCHQDPHDGIFSRSGLPAAIDGRSDCERCHQTSSFRLADSSFDHAKWAGYPLQGSHAQASCSACHAALQQVDALGRRSARAMGTSCHDCHADVHLGQFSSQGKQDCAACHADTAPSFRLPDFDHEAQTRFTLDETHKKLKCDACHAEQRAADGRLAVRYKPLGMECGDCHAAGEQR
jgi:hypothetical protein